MREPRIVVSDDGAFKKLTEEGWTLRAVHGGKMYFDREVKKTRSQKKAETTPELSEFKKAYPRKDGTSSDAFAAKYAKAASEYGHAEILASLSLWREYWRKSNIASGRPENDTQFVPHATTWLNQKRYSETPSAVFVTEKMTDEMVLKELLAAVPEAYRSKVEKKARAYLSEHTEKKPDAGLISRILASIPNA